MKWWLPNASQIEYFEREFAQLEKEYDVRGRLLPALAEVVARAELWSVPLPDRTLEKLLDLIRSCYEAKTGRKRSRLTQFKQDHIHWRRYVALADAFRWCGIDYSKRSGRPKKAVGGLGGIDDARELAKERVRGTIAQVNSLRQIQDSYDLVKKDPVRFAFFNR